MTLFQAIFLAIVQGMTEFLPVSSSGHLVLFQKIFGITKPPVFFDVLLHLGSLGAIILFFKKEIISLIMDWKNKINLWKVLIIGSLPAAIFGFFLNKQIETVFNSLVSVGIMWVFFGLFLLGAQKLKVIKGKSKENLEEVGWLDSLVVGLFQALALFPGISRSGSTIVGGLFRGLSSKTAFTLSFLLAIPAILGAVALKLKDGNFNEIGLGTAGLAIFLAGAGSYLSLKFLQKILKSDKFSLFGYYCLLLGAMVLAYSSVLTNRRE